MAKECPICGKKSIWVRQYKKLMSRYNPRDMKRKYPNLQWVRIPLDIKKPAYKKFAGKRILACTKCIKTLAKRK
jgi:ribosomal protein L28